MKKFVLLTRGRTGSTAVLDEIGKSSNILATQELFSRNTFTERKLKDYFKLLLPFDLWKLRGGWWKRLLPAAYSDARQAHAYLICAEKQAQSKGARGFGWKVLSHQLDERPFLTELLKRHGYCVIYLKRNSVRQVLSGMVANQRGIYNSLEKVVDERRYHIDIDDFKWRVQWERECVQKDIALLNAEGFAFIEVTYEDFCAKREVFYGAIFKMLGLPMELPPTSDFVKMIEDPKSMIENYEEVAKVAAEMGERL